MKKNIIITGSSQGIGFETVKEFATSSNYKIIAISRNENKLMALKNECLKKNPKANVFPIAFDLVTGDYQHTLLPFIQSHFSSIDILINNAGKLISKTFSELNEVDFDQVFDVNIKSIFKLTQMCLPLMNKGSHIVNISSMGGVQGSVKFPGLSIYSASKGAVSIFTETLAEELKEQQISINALALGSVQTEMLSQAFPDFKAALTPQEMATYLCEFSLNGHKYYNGKVLPVSSTTP